MGWFTGEYEWVAAQKPVILKVYINDGTMPAHTKVYDEDLVYHNSKLGMELSDLLSDTAEQMAHRRAYTIRTEGVCIDDIHYPVHRIKRVEVVKGKWEWVQETQYVSKLEVQEDV